MKFTNRRIANTIIISTLLVASIASIGFSSWLIEGGGVKEDNGVVDIEVGKVGDFTDCVTIDESKDNGGFIPLYYCSTGFINSSSSSTNTPTYQTSGNIIFYLKINLANTKAKLTTDSIYLIPTLSLEGKGGNTTSFATPSVEVTYLNNKITTEATSDKGKTKWTSSHLLENFKYLNSETGEIYLSLTYTLTPSSSATFSKILSYLSTAENNAKMVLYLTLGEYNA